MNTSIKEKAKRDRKRGLAELKREEARKRKFWRLIWSGIGALVILGLAVFVLVYRGPQPGEKLEVMTDQTHVVEATDPHTPYTTDPPTSGPHLPYIAEWGAHREELPKELLVHNLEDAGVVIYYNQQADEAAIGKLEEIVGGYKQYVLVSPYKTMPNLITLTAWGRMLRLDTLDETQVQEFIRAYKGIDHHPRGGV
ncbi:DUF3105 domain-containing protein [Paenibacillus sp. y28]|uniref:DUF3105 domain-containing protein n=1 Tax=Paenibacillus sp. y28 TaxID=3129110 RepID=UPI003015939E